MAQPPAPHREGPRNLRQSRIRGYTAGPDLSRRRTIWRPRLFVVTFLVASLVALLGLRTRDGGVKPAAAALRAPQPLLDGDADRDGVADALESAIAKRYAPVVILDPGERYRPASIDWLAGRLPGGGPTDRPRALSLMLAQLGHGGAQFTEAVRSGSGDPRDWVTYVHVYPRVDGGLSVQYWFFYPYNHAPLPFFNHEGDWEHVTVELQANGDPRGVSFAQHRNNDPGEYRSWAAVRRVGEHPIVLSARGTHASYPDQRSVAWFDRASSCVGVRRLRRYRLAHVGGRRPSERGRAWGHAGRRRSAGVRRPLGWQRAFSERARRPSWSRLAARLPQRRLRLVHRSKQ